MPENENENEKTLPNHKKMKKSKTFSELINKIQMNHPRMKHVCGRICHIYIKKIKKKNRINHFDLIRTRSIINLRNLHYNNDNLSFLFKKENQKLAAIIVMEMRTNIY